MNRTIRTAAELDALPVKAVLLDEGGWPVWRDPHEGWCASNGTQTAILPKPKPPPSEPHDAASPTPQTPTRSRP